MRNEWLPSGVKSWRAGLLVLIVMYGVSARADEKAWNKYKDLTPEQIAKLPESVRKSELPMGLTFAASKALAKDGPLALTMDLASLMYPAVSDLPAAIRAFQADHSQPATGSLTVGQISDLTRLAELQKLTPVMFPTQDGSWIADQTASVTGTLTLLDEKIAYPINQVKVNCYKADRYCEFSQVKMSVPKDDSWAQSYGVLIDGVDIFRITNWNSNTIDAQMDTANSCRIVSLSLNFDTKEYFYITKNGKGSCEVLGTKLDRLPKPRIGQIVKGDKIVSEEFRAIEMKAYAALSSDFRRRVDATQTKAPQP